MSHRATGRLGRMAFATRGNLSTVAPIFCPKDWSYPARPTTPRRIQTISAKWATLTPAQKAAWSTAASDGHTGFTQFLRVNTCRLLYSMTLQSTPSSASAFSDDLRVQLKVSALNPFTFQAKLTASTWRHYYVWLRAAPVNFTRYADTRRYGRIRAWFTSSGTTRTIAMSLGVRAAQVSFTALPVLGAGPSLRLCLILRDDGTFCVLHADPPFSTPEGL